MKNTKCSCGSILEYSYTKTRDIIDYTPAVATEIRHMIDVHGVHYWMSWFAVRQADRSEDLNT